MGIQINSNINTGSLPKNFSSIGLTSDEQKMVDQLKARDAEVRAHENAHKSAGGQYVMGESCFATRPDRTARGTPLKAKLELIRPVSPETRRQPYRRLALSERRQTPPASPSAQDRSVASQAAAMEMEAQWELAKKRLEKMKNSHAVAASQDTLPTQKNRKPETPIARKYATDSETGDFMNRLLDVYY